MQNPHDANVLQYFDYIVKNITLGSLLASVKQLAQVRNRPQGVVRNEIARGTCPVPTFLDGGRRVATVLACARWLAEQDGFGLPVADFEIVDVPQELISWGNATDLHDLGGGLAFGSKALPHVQELSISHLQSVSLQLRKDVVLFDWWVHNADRTLSEHGGNPNLLWDQETSKLAVIDHNQAFDESFSPQNFAELHVFHENLPSIFDDLVERIAYRDRLAATFAEFDLACDNVPAEWWWVDEGVPASFNREAVREILGRFDSDNFWRIA